MPRDVVDCPVCEKIPRIVSGDESVWSAAGPLVPPVPKQDGSLFTRCPTCAAGYQYSRSTERDITYEDVSTELRRLDDAKLLDVLQGAEGERFAKELPARIERWRATLEHPQEWLRRDAAWNLAALARREKRWDEQIALLQHVHADVRNEIATGLVREPLAEAPQALAIALAQARDDAREKTRVAAAMSLTTWRIAHGEARLAVDEVVRDTDPARAAATIEALRWNPTPVVLEECVRTLSLLYREEAVRDGVAWLLREAAQQGAGEKIVPGLLDFLRDDDASTANAALLVFEVVPIRCDELASILPRWCAIRQTEYRAYVLLQSQAKLGTDLTPLLPMLGDRLERLAASEPASTAKVLLAMLPHANENPLPVARELLRGVPGRWDTTILGAIDQAAQRSGADLRPLEPRLREILREVESGKRDFIAGWVRQVLGRITGA